MRKFLLLLFCLLTLRLQATAPEPAEPIGQRFGLSLLEVLDSVQKEGLYHYIGSSGKPSTPDAPVMIDFLDASRTRLLTYSFTHDKCDLASMMLPLADLDSLVRRYDQQFPSMGKQVWRTPYGSIRVIVAIGAESLMKDHRPHLRVIFDPTL